MDIYAEKLGDFIRLNLVQAEHLYFDQSCHSVAEAAQAVHAAAEDFVKNICLMTGTGQLLLAIVKGEDRVSPERIAVALEIDPPRMAKPIEILTLTGYPCGGTPSFGYPAQVLIDPHVLENEFVYSGGGSENALVRISTQELLRASRGRILLIRK
ncbi:MAG: YbaK/EbsC family protein [Anaerolineaceae bacterium]|nr:YbaK/EbsC family protein [Anaerolineaceae bacterium]